MSSVAAGNVRGDAWVVPVARGRVVGVGIDIVRAGRVTPRLAARIYGKTEQRVFAAQLEVPFAAREAIIKAVGGPGVLAGAPLQAMTVTTAAGELHFCPDAAYQTVLSSRAIQAVTLHGPYLLADHYIVAAIAMAQEKVHHPCTVIWKSVPIGCSDPLVPASTKPTAEEAAFASTCPRPVASRATRQAARWAAYELGYARESFHIGGGGSEAPFLQGVPGGFLSLAHEDAWAVAVVGQSSNHTPALEPLNADPS